MTQLYAQQQYVVTTANMRNNSLNNKLIHNSKQFIVIAHSQNARKPIDNNHNNKSMQLETIRLLDEVNICDLSPPGFDFFLYTRSSVGECDRDTVSILGERSSPIHESTKQLVIMFVVTRLFRTHLVCKNERFLPISTICMVHVFPLLRNKPHLLYHFHK